MEALPPPRLSGGHPVVGPLHQPGVPSLDEVASLWDVLDAVDGPVIPSGDVANQLGVSTETARRKLNSAESDGVLTSRKTAGRVVHWRPDSQDGSETDDVEGLETWFHGRTERAASHSVAERSLVWLREHGGVVQRMDTPVEEWADADPLDRTADTL